MGSQCYIVTHHTSHSTICRNMTAGRSKDWIEGRIYGRRRRNVITVDVGEMLGRKEGHSLWGRREGRGREASLDMGPGAIGLGRHPLSVGRGNRHGMGSRDANQGGEHYMFLYKLL